MWGITIQISRNVFSQTHMSVSEIRSCTVSGYRINFLFWLSTVTSLFLCVLSSLLRSKRLKSWLPEVNFLRGLDKVQSIKTLRSSDLSHSHQEVLFFFIGLLKIMWWFLSLSFPHSSPLSSVRMEGGELFNRIKSKQQLSEPVAKLYFYQMLKAVQVGPDTLVRSKAGPYEQNFTPRCNSFYIMI